MLKLKQVKFRLWPEFLAKGLSFLRGLKAIAVLLAGYYIITLIRASSSSTTFHDDLGDSAEVNDRFNATLTRKLIRAKLRYLRLNLSFPRLSIEIRFVYGGR